MKYERPEKERFRHLATLLMGLTCNSKMVRHEPLSVLKILELQYPTDPDYKIREDLGLRRNPRSCWGIFGKQSHTS